MGDRTYCSYTIHKDNLAKIKANLGIADNFKVAEHLDASVIEDEGDTVQFYDYEANYGTIEKLQDYLSEHEIEYDKRWEAGGDYDAGNEYYRIIEGKPKCYEIYDDSYQVVVALETLLKEAAQGKDLKTLVEAKIRKLVPFEEGPLLAPSNSKHFITEE